MRHSDWSLRLAKLLRESQDKPFIWGEFDCCLFVSDCAVAVCGVDPAEAYRGRYKTEVGAKRALIKIHGSIEAAFDACFERIDPALVQRGDIITYKDDDGLSAAAVSWSNGFWAALRDGGVGRIECEPVAAWRVE